jgi:hypothetical protein
MKTQIKKQYRTLNFERGEVNEDDRTVELSFSSELPVMRYFGNEILDHNPKSVDLSRLNNSAAVLEDHKGGQIGVVLGAKIENGRGMAKIKFSQSQRGQEIYQDVLDGIRKNVSFGYELRNLTLEEEKEGEAPTYRSTDWSPYEISIVGVPADPTVGIGRSSDEVVECEVPENFRDLTVNETILEEKEETPNKIPNYREKILTLRKISLRQQTK